MNKEENKQSVYSVKDFNLWYGDTHGLKEISLEIPEKEVVAIIGPSGCGKSTFIKALNRMVELVPSVKMKGTICYEGKDIKDAKVESLRTEVGMVFQKPNPFPKSIYDNIAYGPRIHGIKDKNTLDEVVEKV